MGKTLIVDLSGFRIYWKDTWIDYQVRVYVLLDNGREAVEPIFEDVFPRIYQNRLDRLHEAEGDKVIEQARTRFNDIRNAMTEGASKK